MKVHVTQRATELVADFFKNKASKPIRISPKTGGCGFQRLAVSLEEPRETDETFHIDGFDYIVDRAFLEKAQPIEVDSDGIGFRLSGRGYHPPTGCGTCGMMGCR